MASLQSDSMRNARLRRRSAASLVPELRHLDGRADDLRDATVLIAHRAGQAVHERDASAREKDG